MSGEVLGHGKTRRRTGGRLLLQRACVCLCALCGWVCLLLIACFVRVNWSWSSENEEAVFGTCYSSER
jgi:hypothetical protein